MEGIGKSPSEIESLVEDEVQEFQRKLATEETDAEVRRLAFSVVKNELLNLSGNADYAGNLEEVPLISLGYQRREAGRWIVQDSDGLQAACVVAPPDRQAGLAILIVEESHIDLDHAKSVLDPLNTVRARVGVRRVEEPTIRKAGNATYNLRVSEESRLEYVDPDDLDSSDPLAKLPAEEEEKRSMINGSFFPDEEIVTVRDFVEHESVMNERGYPAGLGVDMKRFRGEVVDSVKFDFGSGIMTILDDSVFDEQEIPTQLTTEKTRTPGAQVQVDNDFVFGEGSIVDIYGPVSQNPSNQQYSIQAYGVVPIVKSEYDDGIVDTGSDEPAEEETI